MDVPKKSEDLYGVDQKENGEVKTGNTEAFQL